ncbi:uncharacterized protein LOC128224063 [Mya arenaria]|uniref:uncharacterized protein LOC128224063 n=1 Tax=Mya arenaria TaxID=6604 RepID=UPI0022DFD9E1|nr:uncharacterized protein LOC128224063 [Mya arenaria]
MGNWFSIRGRGGRSSDEVFSVRACEVLDHLGYSQSMVRHRRDAWRERDCIVNNNMHVKDITEITAGSKCEGFTVRYESDTDRVYLYNYARCRIQGDVSISQKNHYEFTMNSESCHPGYFRLELKHIGNIENSHIQQALFVDDKGRTFISSEKYMLSHLKGNNTKETVSGPAVTWRSEYANGDNVYALPCTSQQMLLSEWINRRRHHNWPTPDLIEEVSKLDAQMVPVGCKSSENKDIEWRISFNTGEKRLTDSWNDSQYKIYIFFRWIMKSQLKSISDEISSYILKNIIMWYIETNPAKRFKNKYLLENVISCMKNLQDAIKTNQLRYYMIPGRNLLTGKINPEQQQLLIEKLHELITEGPQVILRCPKAYEALQMSPAELSEKGRWRDELDKIELERVNLWWQNWEPGIEWKEVTNRAWGNPYYKRLWERIRDIVWPLWTEYEGNNQKDIVMKKLTDALS